MARFWFAVLCFAFVAAFGTAGALECDTISIADALRRFGVYGVIILASMVELKDRLFEGGLTMINNECQTGLSPTGHCGAAYYCERDYSCCAACPDICNVRCGWMGDGQNRQLVFSASKFKRNAPLDIRKRVGDHVSILDGMPVSPCDNGKYYACAYEADGDYWSLYPIDAAWCEDAKEPQ